MSVIFHKSCYTSRSSGYKYRTLSTSTGKKDKRDSLDGNTFERNFKHLKREISTRIDDQLNQTRKARESIQEKLVKLDCKINSILELQTTIECMRKDLQSAEFALVDIMEKVNKLEMSVSGSEGYSV